MKKQKLHSASLKVAVASILMVLLVTSSAEAYYRIGRVWSSTSAAKYPTVYSGGLSASLVSTASSMNLKWGGLSNSTLQTGNVYVTSSLTAYENASFKMWMEDNYVTYGDSSPAVTFTCSGCNYARVVLSSRWIWSNQFVIPATNPNYFGYVDSATVILHELGHAYGLDHPDNDPNTALTSAEIASVMYVNFTIKRNVTADDISGIASMY